MGDEDAIETVEAVEPEAVEPDPQEEDAGPVVVQIGDAEPDDDDEDIDVPDDAPKWAKRVREKNEERRKENRELKKRLAELEAKAKPAEEPTLGAKPKLADFDFDEDAHEQALDQWYADKRKHDEVEGQRRKAQEEAEAAWNAKVAKYQEGKKALRVDDFEDAEEVVTSLFDQTQQGIMLQGAKDATLLAYAIGKDPKRAKELAALKDPIQFAFAVAKLEEQIKVSTRKPATKPEGTISSTARGSASTDNVLDRLREEAARTGDYSKVMAYKRQAVR